MPYVKEAHRDYYKEDLDNLANRLSVVDIEDAKGDLNFICFTLVVNWLRRKGMKYFTVSTMIGALEDCADELRRRYLHPREDVALEENGDI